MCLELFQSLYHIVDSCLIKQHIHDTNVANLLTARGTAA